MATRISPQLEGEMICKRCFYKHRTNVQWPGCKHTGKKELSVIWNQEEQRAETTSASVRSFPSNFPSYLQHITMCDPHNHDCVGEHCVYAHGKAEWDSWTAQLKENLLIPSRRKSASESSSSLSSRGTHIYANPTADQCFKHIMMDANIRNGFFTTFAGFPVSESVIISEFMNPIKSYESLRVLFHSQRAKSVYTKYMENKEDEPKVFCNGREQKAATIFYNQMMQHFKDLVSIIPRKEYSGSMGFTCESANGEKIIVEVQVIPMDYWDKRQLVYAANVYAQQMKESSDWSEVQKVVSIAILGGAGGGSSWKGREFKSHFVLRDVDTAEAYPSIGIEIFQYSIYAFEVEEKDIYGREMADWVTFLKRAHYMTEDEVENCINSPIVKEAFKRATFEDLPHAIQKACGRHSAQVDQWAQYADELAEEGRQEGRQEGMIQGVKKALSIAKAQESKSEIIAELKRAAASKL